MEFGDITAPNRDGESSLPAYFRRGMNVISTVAVDTLVKPFTEAIDEMFPTPAPPSDANKVRILVCRAGYAVLGGCVTLTPRHTLRR